MSQQQDDAFVKTFIMVLAALIVFTISVFVLAQIIGDSANTAFEPPAAVVADRTKPVGEVKTESTDETATATATVQKSGEEIYNTACVACHGTGAAGAPKFGDKAAWAPRLAKGTEALLNSALNGFNAMPPRGGNASLSDEDIKKTIDYMLAAAQAEQPETAPEATSAPQPSPAEQPETAPEATPAPQPASAEQPETAPEATPTAQPVPAEQSETAPEAAPAAQSAPVEQPEVTPPTQ